MQTGPIIAVFTAICVAFSANSAQAGAWLRDKGELFFSLGHQRYSENGGTHDQTDAYLEYGLTGWLSIGVDAGRSSYDSGDNSVAFLRFPVAKPMGGHRFAALVGLGRYEHELADELYFIRNGVSWGYGFQSPFGAGFLGLDFTTDFQPETALTARKLDATVGLDLNARTKMMLQVQSGDFPEADPYVRLAPSLLRQIGPGRHLELGLRYGIAGEDSRGIKIGTWLAF